MCTAPGIGLKIAARMRSDGTDAPSAGISATGGHRSVVNVVQRCERMKNEPIKKTIQVA